MPTLQWNMSAWKKRDWRDQGENWSRGWGNSAIQWHVGILPRIRAFLPARAILEIAPGYGRWTQFLIPYAQRIFRGVDLAENCAQHCRERFSKAHRNIAFYSNDGISLKAAEAGGGYDFIFSYDSLVHASPEVFESYVPQIMQLLNKNGAAFIHHSNLKAALAAQVVTPDEYLHERDRDVSAESVAGIVMKNNGKMLFQETFPCGEARDIDALSIFTRADSEWKPSTPLSIRNDDAPLEASYGKRIFSCYSFEFCGNEQCGVLGGDISAEEFVELQQRYKRLKSSWSWKLTSPLRALGRLAKKVKGGK
jgi:SAM-dependent methyltransferase